MKQYWKWLLGLLLMGLFVGCFKEVEYRSTVVIKAFVSESKDVKEPLHNILVYGYAVDTADYAPLNYADALAGVLTHKRNAEKRINPERTGEDCTVDGHGPSQMVDAAGISSLYLLVIDLENRIYGYTQLALVENLSYLYLTVNFEKNKTETKYKSGNWMFFNEFYVPDVTCTVRATTQIIEGGSLSTLKESQLFAYAVENPEEWYVASYAEAEVGRIRHIENNAVRDFDYSASSNTSGDAKISFPPRNYLLLLFNRSQRGYGVRPLTYKEMCGEDAEIPTFPEFPVRPLANSYQGNPQNKTLTICFVSWQSISPYEDENGWSIYVEPAPEPEPEPAPDETPEEEIPEPIA